MSFPCSRAYASPLKGTEAFYLFFDFAISNELLPVASTSKPSPATQEPLR
jgi:hypothetical protein